MSQAAPGFERIVAPGSVLERVAHGLIFTEGPVWVPAAHPHPGPLPVGEGARRAGEGALIFTDIRGDRLIRWRPGLGLETLYAPSSKANGLTLDQQGRIVVAGWGSRTVWRLEPDGSVTVLASHWQGKKINTPNDIVQKSDGTIWWTDMANAVYIPGMCGEDVQRYLDFEGVFRVSPDGSDMTLLGDDFVGPNGLCFSPDESLLYVNETPRRRIRVFDVRPDNTLSNGRVFYTDTGTEPGVPDGMKVDVEGNVYCTGSAGFHVIDPNGRLLGRVHVPEHVSNLAWGGEDWRTLYITARGVVYRTWLGIPGVPHGQKYRQQVLAPAR
ncbi:MAG TPA: SMP-30/gluconolactonase/LRE family protein [Chloroflexota bacterium]|nr:SMP-30/gluconolactonase/LRE family protein [Chloroflexota bacterium]